MGSQILKISPFSVSRTLIHKSSPTPLFISNKLSKTHLTSSSAKQGASGFGGFPGRVKRSFRSGIVAMAGPGSVQKSEDEWRAVLSPEQFRILRQKGTEYVSFFYFFCFCFVCVVMSIVHLISYWVFVFIVLGWPLLLNF